MERSPWEATSHLLIQLITNTVWKPRDRYHVYKNSPLVAILRKVNPIHYIPSYSSETICVGLNALNSSGNCAYVSSENSP
jgi:hypothetical protein